EKRSLLERRMSVANSFCRQIQVALHGLVKVLCDECLVSFGFELRILLAGSLQSLAGASVCLLHHMRELNRLRGTEIEAYLISHVVENVDKVGSAFCIRV